MREREAQYRWVRYECEREARKRCVSREMCFRVRESVEGGGAVLKVGAGKNFR